MFCTSDKIGNHQFTRFIPDGFFPWAAIEALVDEKGAYIVESLKIQYGHSSQMVLNDEHNFDYHQELTGFATTYSSSSMHDLV